MLIGYSRVSTTDQQPHLQIDALRKAGVDFFYSETASGGSMRRPKLNEMLGRLQSGDTVVVYKLDRIARSLRDLLKIIEMIEHAGAEFRSLTEHIDTQSAVGRMIFQIVGAFAEFERELIRERTRVGMAAAVARGAKPGRPRGMDAADEAEAVKLWQAGRHTKTALARKYGVHISSIKRAIWRAEEATQPQLPLLAA